MMAALGAVLVSAIAVIILVVVMVAEEIEGRYESAAAIAIGGTPMPMTALHHLPMITMTHGGCPERMVDVSTIAMAIDGMKIEVTTSSSNYAIEEIRLKTTATGE
jgi:hypothetical protein